MVPFSPSPASDVHGGAYCSTSKVALTEGSSVGCAISPAGSKQDLFGCRQGEEESARLAGQGAEAVMPVEGGGCIVKKSHMLLLGTPIII
jgi:hypothetical protein